MAAANGNFDKAIAELDPQLQQLLRSLAEDNSYVEPRVVANSAE